MSIENPSGNIESIEKLEELPVSKVTATEKLTEIKIHPESAATPGFEIGQFFAINEDFVPVGVKQSFFAPVQRPRAPKPHHRFAIGIMVGGKAVQLPLGLTVISGDTGSGKSSLVRALEKKNKKFERVISVEAYDSANEIENVPTFDNATGALAYAISEQIKDPAKLVFIDSLRAPVFETNGPAGEKGVIMPFFTQLTRVSNSLARQGRTVVAIVNPMNEGKEYVDSFLKKLSSGLPSFVHLRQSTDPVRGAGAMYEGDISLRAAGESYHRVSRAFLITDVSKVGPSKAVSTASFPSAPEKTLSLTDRAISKLN